MMLSKHSRMSLSLAMKTEAELRYLNMWILSGIEKVRPVLLSMLDPIVRQNINWGKQFTIWRK